MNMKNRITILSIIILILLLILSTNVSAATITSTDKQVQSGNNVTITVSSKTKLGAYTLKLTDTGGLTLVNTTAVSGMEVSSDKRLISGASSSGVTTLGTFTFSTPTVNSTTKYNIKFTITGMETPEFQEIPNESNTATITVTPKTNQGGQNGGNNGGGSSGGNNGGSTTTVTEPKFTSANKTVYATGDINLRSSWSTSSSATKISKGTELKLTGTSSQKVNGYVWYRVTYNGQTKYVSRDLITETNPQEKEGKSNNTNLKVLSIEGVELTPVFSANVTEYSVKLVNYKEQSLKINAEAEDEKSTVKVEGNEEIKIGENVISITVTAEDGTTKVYKVAVTNEEKEALGLSSLVIKGVELKSFSPSKFNYEIEFKELDKLEIEAIANEEGATVEIIGNENLTEIGEHVITIMVTSADGEQIATYTITANKLAVEEEKQELNVKSILICALIALVVLVAIVILIVRYVKGNSGAEVDYIYNDNLENNEENSEEVKETKLEEENENQEDIKETEKVEEKKKTDKKPTIDELYADYDDEPIKKRGKGRHSK